MEKMRLTDLETKEFFIQAFKNKLLVPILGSGFSGGMRARKNNTVPTGYNLKEHMISEIEKVKPELTKSTIAKQSFSWIAERFFKYVFSSQVNIVCDYFFNFYTGIKFIHNNKFRFLNSINWPYVYTLNIDTTIENSNDQWEVFYPNCDFFDKSVFDKKKLYKIHGDINQFLKTKNKDDLIFSESQYLLSLDTNYTFHNLLASDCAGKNLLYIGCSLDDELDIHYSVLSDLNKNKAPLLTRRIYVTSEDIEKDYVKQENLQSFNISHYIQLENVEDYELFYEFITNCYELSLLETDNEINRYEITNIPILNKDREKNLTFLISSFNTNQILQKPYYYITRDTAKQLRLSLEHINVFIGRRFSGKTMLAFNIIDYYKDRKIYYVKSDDSISDKLIISLLNEKNSVIIFDSNSISEEQIYFLSREYSKVKNRTSYVCIFFNSYDEISNIISYRTDIYEQAEPLIKGYLSDDELNNLNEKINEIVILAFDPKLTILDNTLRIASKSDSKYLCEYEISSLNELILLVWLAVHKKIYFEELVNLNLLNSYRDTVNKYSPIIQIETNVVGEKYEHSALKIVCNAPLALLHIISIYAYPLESELGKAIRITRLQKICEAIYQILLRENSQTMKSKIKAFLMFDVLNDIFSRQYAEHNISILSKDEINFSGLYYGAASVIQAIYDDENIKNLQKDEPNYWLQKAKSLYMLNSYKDGAIKKLEEALLWAQKAEADSETKINNGENKFFRTLSNSVIQVAMIYGKLSYKYYYKDTGINSHAVHYYYKGLLDSNNSQAAQSLINRSKGTKDLDGIIKHIRNGDCPLLDSVILEAEYLCNLPKYSKGINIRLNKSRNI